MSVPTLPAPTLIAVDTHRANRTVWTGVIRGDHLDPETHHGRNQHDRVLAAGVRRWMDAHPEFVETLDGIAVVTGPGGFTGLRVGVAFATGLATALSLPVVPVSTVRLLAAMWGGEWVWSLTRAAGETVRAQTVRIKEGRLQSRGPAIEFEPTGADVDAIVREHATPLPCGEGYERHKAVLDEVLIRHAMPPGTPKHPYGPGPALALAATTAWREGLARSPLEIDVDYGADFRPTPKPGD